MSRAALTLRWLVALTQGATATHQVTSGGYQYQSNDTPPPSTPSSAPAHATAVDSGYMTSGTMKAKAAATAATDRRKPH
eukprot:scaffold40421_cov61-Phaeocystis_antarctica.AAC.3